MDELNLNSSGYNNNNNTASFSSFNPTPPNYSLSFSILTSTTPTLFSHITTFTPHQDFFCTLKMATTSFSSLQIAMSRSCVPSSQKFADVSTVVLGSKSKAGSWNKLASACHVASVQPFQRSFTSSSAKSVKIVTKATSESTETSPISGLPINLKGKRAFIAGVADDNGYGWAIAKSLAAAGAEILLGTWVPALNIFESSLRRGKFDESRVLPDGSLMEITKVYPLDAVFDNYEDVPEDIKTNKRYAGSSKWTVQEVAESVKEDFGSIDILVHSLANGPEVTKPLLETSRNGYLAALSASSYSYVSLLKHFLPILNPGGSSLSLTYIASERIIPGYGGGMSSAKAALESDTRVLAFEAGRKRKIRVNTISAGPLRSRAAKAIGFIDMMIDYSTANAPLQKELSAEEVGNAAAFLSSPLASAITGTVLYVDNGLNAMGVGVDSPIFKDLNIPKDQH
ncbi:enoyl-[acyl-carrier-protein] reductase [NADH], chloroplastic [Trifolium repens]|nr:enoyl-[acyl-carrier-protein] reductase [NADH], chloroplastic [Trifolium repens]